jgi:HSP20 family molecular chaperone IbpA
MEDKDELEKRLRKKEDEALSRYGLYVKAGPDGKQTLAKAESAEELEGADWLVESSFEGESVIVTAHLPGKKLDDISVEIGEESLAISSRKSNSVPKLYPLPCKVLIETAKTSMRHGILKLTLSRK